MKRPRIRRWTPLVLMAGFFSIAGAAHVLELRANWTSSLPRGIYQLVDEPLERGALVILCLEGDAASRALERGYLPRGRCPSGLRPILKTVVAVDGDQVVTRPIGVEVNGCRLTASTPRHRDRSGHLLPVVRGAHILGVGEVWLHNPSPDSWDSRYFGPISLDEVRWSVARPVLTLPHRPPTPEAVP